MGDVFDLDAAAAEAGLEPKTMRFAGREFTLPAVLPLGALTALNDGRTGSVAALAADDDEAAANASLGGLDKALRVLFGDQADAILAAGFGFQHLDVLLEGLYGVDAGEAEASSTSLNRAGRRSRQTSPTSTGVISDGRASVPMRSARAS